MPRKPYKSPDDPIVNKTYGVKESQVTKLKKASKIKSMGVSELVRQGIDQVCDPIIEEVNNNGKETV